MFRCRRLLVYWGSSRVIRMLMLLYCGEDDGCSFL